MAEDYDIIANVPKPQEEVVERDPSPEPRAPTPEPIRAPTPEPVRAPTPEPVWAPTPEPARAPTPEPVIQRDPSPEPPKQEEKVDTRGVRESNTVLINNTCSTRLIPLNVRYSIYYML